MAAIVEILTATGRAWAACVCVCGFGFFLAFIRTLL